MIGLAVLGGLVVSQLAAPDLTAGERRVALVVGADVGDPGEDVLEYAEADAERVHRMLTEVGGVEADRAYLVLGGNAEQTRRTLAEVTGRVAELRRQGPTTLIFYAAAHADARDLHLSGSHYALDELRDQLTRTGADLRLVIVDACRTPVRAQARGGSPGPEVALARVQNGAMRGEVYIASAALGEPAQEWSYLRGALFTHHLLAGLRGLADVDRDGSVTLAEVYAFAYRRTTVGAASSGLGAQRPSFEIGTSGFGDWVFARPAKLGASLVLDESVEGQLYVADRRDELLAELVKARGESVVVGLQPGWYRVLRPAGDAAFVADVNLSFGGRRVLGDGDFTRTSRTRARKRGLEPIALVPWTLSVGYLAQGGLVQGLGLASAAELRLEHELGPWVLRGRASGTAGSFRATRSTVEQRELRTLVGVGYRRWVEPLRLGVALDAGVSWVEQAIRRDDAEQLARLFGRAADAPRYGLVPTLGASLVGELPLGERWVVGVEGGAQLAWIEVGGARSWTLRPEVGVRVGWSF